MWKRSKDGGLDFDVDAERKRRFIEKKYNDAKEQMFNPYGTAHTMTFGSNTEKVTWDGSIRNKFDRIRNRQNEKGLING